LCKPKFSRVGNDLTVGLDQFEEFFLMFVNICQRRSPRIVVIISNLYTVVVKNFVAIGV
jgi:hypothetical protein